MQQRIEFGGHELAHFAQPVEQLAGIAGAGWAQAAGDPAQVGIDRRQQVRLLVVQVLDAVLDTAQEDVALGQTLGGGRLHQRARAQALQALQGRTRADFGELPAARDQHQLHDELDLADAAARQLHVVGALGPPGGAALCFVADLAVQLAQAFEHAVVQIAAIDKGRHEFAQRQRTPTDHAGARGHHAALQPGKTLPLAALHLKVLLQHLQAAHRRAGVAVGAQREVDAKDEAVVGGLADQRVQPLGHAGKELVRADALRTGCFALVLIDIDQVDVGGHVQLARAELAHADDPELDGPALRVQRCAVALLCIGQRLRQCQLQGRLGECRHAAGDGVQRRVLLDVQAGQPFQAQLARHAHGAAECASAVLQALHQRGQGRVVGRARRQQGQLIDITPPYPLHEAAVRRLDLTKGR